VLLQYLASPDGLPLVANKRIAELGAGTGVVYKPKKNGGGNHNHNHDP
jgi:hypothetical protein